MPLNKAFELSHRDKGSHFDPVVLHAFVRYYENEGRLDDVVYSNIPRNGADGPKVSALVPQDLYIWHKETNKVPPGNGVTAEIDGTST